MPDYPHRIAQTAIAFTVVASMSLASASTASAGMDPDPSSPADAVMDISPIIQDAAALDVQTSAIDANTVTVEGATSAIEVTLPVSSGAETTTEGGLVELSDNASSSIIPVVLDDGSVAIHAVLNDETAPTTYDYTFALPQGATFEILADNGGAIAINTDGTPALFIAPPWATDSEGASVATHYSVSGDTITQHIMVNADTAFPVVADPWAGVDLVGSFTWTWVSGSGWKININPTLWARGYTGNPWWVSVGNAGWSELYNKVGARERPRLNESGKGQYVCHMGFAGFDAQWNLELWKPSKSLTSWVSTMCN